MMVNTQLEQLKIKHTQELRDLRRRMRESGNLGPLVLPRGSAAPREGRIGEEDEGEDYLDEDEEEEEQSWDELLEQDRAFAAIAARLEALTRRGREAILFEPKGVEGGRVLNRVEVEAQYESGEEEEEEDEGNVSGPTGLGISARPRPP